MSDHVENIVTLEYKTMKVEIQNQVAHVQFTRADELNTMNLDFWHELPEVMHKIDDEVLARVVVISSTGKHFSAGMDLSVFTGAKRKKLELGRKHENLRRTVKQLQACLSVLEEVRIPVLVASQGGCIGGALSLATAADCRYCTKDAFFSVEETKLGMTADVGCLQRLPSLMPLGLVRELAFSGRRMYADEAKTSGLVNRVFDDQTSMISEVLAIAADMAQRSPLALAGCKEMINYGRDHSVEESLKQMALWQAGMFQPETDMMESFMAKSQKRETRFAELCPVTSPLT
jgi:enoyl-CoA hydratase